MSMPILRTKLRRDLRRKRRQVIAVALTVFLGVGLFIASWDTYRNLQSSYSVTYERTDFADVWAHGDDAVAAAVRVAPEVTAVDVRVSADIPMDLGQGAFTGRLLGIPDGQVSTLNRLTYESGGAPAGGSMNGVVLERHTAENFDLGVGSQVSLRGSDDWVEVTVTGVATSPEWLWMAPSSEELLADPLGFGVVFAPRPLADALAPSGSSQVVATVADHDPAAAQAVVDVAYDAGATDAYDRAHHPSDQALQADVEGFRQMAVLFPLLFLCVAALATSVLLGRLIQSQQSEIGMMLAFGFDGTAVVRHFTVYGLLLAVTGGIPAVFVGALGGRVLTDAYTSFLSIPYTSHGWHPYTLVVALVITVAIGTVSGYLPARAAARVTPATAMRPLGDVPTGRRSPLERWMPARFPSWGRVALRNVGRQRRRSASTMFGVMLALILIVTALVMNDSINEVFTRQYGDLDHRGLVVTTDSAVDDDTLAALAAIDAVAEATSYAQEPVLLRSDNGVAAQQLQAYEPGSAAHEFASRVSEPGILVGTAARDELGVEVGDQITVTFPSDAVTASVAVVGLVDEPLSGYSYMSIRTWTLLTGRSPDMAVVTLSDDSAHAAVRSQLVDMTGVVAVEDNIAIAGEAQALLSASRFFVGLMLAFALVLAVALIFNAMTVTIAERESEVANLEANGVGRPWIRRTITLENLVTAFAGIIPGLVLGRVLGGAFLDQFSTAQFRFHSVILPRSLGASVVLIVVAAVVGQVPGLRSLWRIDIAAKVRERGV